MSRKQALWVVGAVLGAMLDVAAGFSVLGVVLILLSCAGIAILARSLEVVVGFALTSGILAVVGIGIQLAQGAHLENGAAWIAVAVAAIIVGAVGWIWLNRRQRAEI